MASPLLSRDPLTGPVTSDESSALTGKASAEEEALIADPSFMDYVKDIWGSTGRGLKENILSYPGAPGDVYELARSADVLNEKYLGDNEPARVEQIRDRENPLPTTEELYKDVTAHPYEPTTTPGRWTKEITSLLSPRGIMRGVEHIGRDVIVPYFAGKGGEMAGAQLGPEEAQLLSAGAGIASGPIYEGGKRQLVPAVSDPVIRNQINTLHDPGPDPQNQLTPVELTGGQVTDSPTLKYLEAGPFGNRAAGIGEQQLRQFTQRALELAGIRGTDRADFATMERAQAELGQQYENLVRANNGINLQDPVLGQSLIDAGMAYERVKGVDPNSPVATYFDRIVEAGKQNGGIIPPDVFQVIHSELSADLKSMRNSPELAQERIALGAMEEALFTSLENSAGVGGQTKALNRQYRNFKILEDAMYSTSTDAARGFITPAALAGAVKRSESKAGFTQGRSDFAELSNAGSSLMKDIGNTASGGRAMVGAIGGGLASGAGLLMAGQPLAAAGAVGAALGAPFASAGISHGLTSRPVRTSIVNRATGLNPAWMNPMQMPPILNQAVQAKPEEPAPVEMTPPVPQRQGALQPLTNDPLDQRRQVAGLPLPDMLARIVGGRIGRV